MLEVERLTKYYQTVLAVDRLSFKVAGGELVGLLGPNGAGKTTVLRSIAGIVQPTDGRIRVAGHDLQTDELAAKRSLGFVPEVPHPFDLLSVSEHLEFIARAYNALDSHRRLASALLQRLELAPKAGELVGTLSKGMRQKLTIACALVHEPPLLLLDEPMVGIDPRGQREVVALLREATSQGRAVLISTHVLAAAEQLCDRVLIVNHGRKVAEGRGDELRDQARMTAGSSLEDVFLTLTEEQPSDELGFDLA